MLFNPTEHERGGGHDDPQNVFDQCSETLWDHSLIIMGGGLEVLLQNN